MLVPIRKFTSGLYSEHLASIGFLLDLRQAYFCAGDVPWTKVAELDARIEAHRDALELGGPDAIDHAVQLLASDDTDALRGAVYHLAWIGPKAAGHKEMIAAWMGAVEDRLAAYGQALRYAAQAHREIDVGVALKSVDPLLLEAALKVSRFLDDVKAEKVLPLCSHEAVAVRRAAVELVALKGAIPLLPALERAVWDESKSVDESNSFWLLALGSARALNAAREACRGGGTIAPHWLMCLAYAGSAADLPLFARAVGNPASRLAALRACGGFGHIELVQVLIAALAATNESERVTAATALEIITAAGLTEQAARALTTEVASADVVGTADGSTKVAEDVVEFTRVCTVQGEWAAWWNANLSRFGASPRWRRGKPATLGVFIEQLAEPSSSDELRRMNQLELVVRSGMSIDCACDGPVAEQLVAIGKWQQWWKKVQAEHANDYWLLAGRA